MNKSIKWLNTVPIIMWQSLLELEWDLPFFDLNEKFSWSYIENLKTNLWELVMLFNELEYDLDSYLCDLFNNNAAEIGMLVIHKMNYSWKIDLREKWMKRYLNISSSKNKILSKKIKDIYQQLRLCWEERNAFVHWYRHQCTIDKRIKTKNNYNENWVEYKMTKIGIREIRRTHARIIKTQDLLYSFNESIDSL
jgi:hypothetical protein